MRDFNDTKTIDAWPEKPKGRPRSQASKTAKERKREQLKRRLLEFQTAKTPPFKECSTAYLLQYLEFLIKTKTSVAARLVADELATRAKS